MNQDTSFFFPLLNKLISLSKKIHQILHWNIMGYDEHQYKYIKV